MLGSYREASPWAWQGCRFCEAQCQKSGSVKSIGFVSGFAKGEIVLDDGTCSD
jgi:hypothetical protein